MFNITHDEMQLAAEPLLKLINERCHPHVVVIVTPSSVELLEGALGIPQINGELKDGQFVFEKEQPVAHE